MVDGRPELRRPGHTGSFESSDGRITATVELHCESNRLAADPRLQRLADQLAQHVAVLDPVALSLEDIPEAVSRVRAELSQAYADKPVAIREKLVAGKTQAYVSQSCLLEQRWVFEDGRTVHEILKDHSVRFGEQLSIGTFHRTERPS